MAADWRADLDAVLGSWTKDSSGVVLSADVDGLLSCALLAGKHPVQVIGVYTTTHLLLLDGATRQDAAQALWLDHDVSEPGVRCVGQHLVHHTSTDTLPRREPLSFNPNVWQKQAWKESFKGRAGTKRDKYPYGTCHFLANAFDVDLGEEASEFAALLAHADGTWRTVVDYRANAEIWYDLMFQGDAFLPHLGDVWHESSEHLDVHAEVVASLVSAGITKSPSRAAIARTLPDDLKALTGCQSVRYAPKNPQGFIDRIAGVLDYVAAQVGTRPGMGRQLTSTVSGEVEMPYPNHIKDFDTFMVENAIFSHAFTGFRELKFTTGIVLQDPGR